ncbi:MAG TPA: type VI secretion system protein TssA [Pseudomonas sp.]|jgi:type VI secretion system protein ImpA
MGTFDVDALLLELDPLLPCGLNLEYDPRFVELERAALGKPEVQYGDTITAAAPPEWKLVKALSLELLQSARDLRIAVPLLRANLALQGMPGLADSLGLIERLLEERWDHVHPQLDPDDDMDPTLRINSLAALAEGTTVIKSLKETSIIVLPVLGPLTLRVIEIANGEHAPAPGQDKVSIASLEAALRDVDNTSLEVAVDAISRAYDSARTIEAILVRKVGSAQALNLDGLTRCLKRGRDFLMPLFTSRNPEAESQEPPDQTAAEGADSASTIVATARAPAPSDEINNRDDVLRLLEKLLKYYHVHEPSSPVPLLLSRAKWLVPKSFMEIMEDLAPESVAQLTTIRGNQGDI